MKTKNKVKKFNKIAFQKKLDKAWSVNVITRDKSCKKCHGRGYISAHHAFGRRHMATRWDLMNGVGLCYPCHIHWAHRDPAGFAVWFEEHIGRDQYYRLSEIHRHIIKHTEEDLLNIMKTLEETC